NLELKAQFVGQLLGYDFSANPIIRSHLDSPQEIRDRAFIHLTEYFKSLAANEPVAIFLDDIHWADESSLDMLIRMSQDFTGYPILFVALTRPTLFERRSVGIPDSINTQVFLKPLSREESVFLVGEVLQKIHNIPDKLQDLIISNAEGNPFYLEELVKMLLEHGVIIKSEPHWQVNLDHLGETHIPSTLTGIIQARLEGLPAGERTILQQASVIGRVFWDASLKYVHQSACMEESRESLEVVDILTSVQGREMIFSRDTSAFSYAVEYIFKHAIMRDVIYESVLIRRRKQYHSHVADWLIAKAGEQAVNFSGLIAGHLEKAGREPEAVDYLKKAANAAISNYAVDDALVFYSRALEHVAAEDDQNRFDLLLGLDRGNYLKGNRDAQKEILDSLQVIAKQLDDPAKQAEVYIRLAWYSFYTSDFPTQLDAARQAKTLASRVGADELLGRADIVEAWALMMTGNESEAIIHATEALELTCKTNMRLEEGNALNLLGMLSINFGDYFKAIEYVEGFIKISHEIGNRERELTALVNISVAYTPLGNYQAAIKSLKDVLTICAETGDRVMESTARINLGWAAQASGDWELAREHLEIGIAMKVEFEQTDAEAEGLLWMAHTWLGLNEPEKALPLLEKTLEYRRELDQPHHIIETTAAIARAYFVKADIANANKQVNEILNYLTEGGSLEGTWEPLRIYWICMQILKEQGDNRYKALLEEAYHFLQERASRISDEKSRQMYLKKVPWHCEIMDLWKTEAV
ncbi:MAG TPA: tetratricopeptide repeat protein, partial [Anaerolineales bacterium]